MIRNRKYIKESFDSKVPKDFLKIFEDDAEIYYECYKELERKCKQKFTDLEKIEFVGEFEAWEEDFIDIFLTFPYYGSADTEYDELYKKLDNITDNLCSKYGDIIFVMTTGDPEDFISNNSRYYIMECCLYKGKLKDPKKYEKQQEELRKKEEEEKRLMQELEDALANVSAASQTLTDLIEDININKVADKEGAIGLLRELYSVIQDAMKYAGNVN